MTFNKKLLEKWKKKRAPYWALFISGEIDTEKYTSLIEAAFQDYCKSLKRSREGRPSK